MDQWERDLRDDLNKSLDADYSGWIFSIEGAYLWESKSAFIEREVEKERFVREAISEIKQDFFQPDATWRND